MKEYSTFLRSLRLNPHSQMVKCHIQSYASAEMQPLTYTALDNLALKYIAYKIEFNISVFIKCSYNAILNAILNTIEY